MKIIIAGGSGQIGVLLSEKFTADGHEVIALTRQPTHTVWRTEWWDGKTQGAWSDLFDGSDVVINLAGRSVNCRYTPENKDEILQSRLKSTRAVGEAIANAARAPRVWLQASSATIYAHTEDGPANSEANGVIGGGEPDAPPEWHFSIEVITAWEKAAQAFALSSTRTVLMRSALTLSPHRNGIYDVMLGLARRGLGGTVGSGRQYVSWIHDQDFIRSVYWLIEKDLSGAINLCSPNPVPNAEFMQTLRETADIRVGVPAAAGIVKLGAAFMHTEAELVLKSRKVLPQRMVDSGFEFQFPEWRAAAVDLFKRHG